MSRISITFLFMCTLALAATGFNAKDQKFVQQAAKAATMEIRLGQTGLDWGGSADVKGLAQRLVDDHIKMNDEITDLASRKGITLDGEDREVRNGLAGLAGSAFDKEFGRIAVKELEEEIKGIRRRKGASGSGC